MNTTTEKTLGKVLHDKKSIDSVLPIKKTNNPFNLISIIAINSHRNSVFEIKYVNNGDVSYLHNQTQRQVKDFIQNEFKNYIDIKLKDDKSTYFSGIHKLLNDYQVRLFDIEAGYENSETHKQERTRRALIAVSNENMEDELMQNTRLKMHQKTKDNYSNKPAEMYRF